MSRAAEQSVADQSKTAASTYNANAQTAFTGAEGSITQDQQDIGQYQTQLSKFAAGNPYGEGGAYQTAVNTSTANTADAGSDAAKQAAEAAAVRTGGNTSAGVAAGQSTDQANTRNLMAEQAKANADRISQGAGYGAKVLQASSVPATLQSAITGDQSRLAGTESGAGGQDLSTEQKADDMPNFGDTFGTEAAGGLARSVDGDDATKIAAAAVGCWVAAEIFGGWFDPRTVDVRRWMFGKFAKTPLGFVVCALYMARGERVAGYIRRWTTLRRVFEPLCNLALKKAREGKDAR